MSYQLMYECLFLKELSVFLIIMIKDSEITFYFTYTVEFH